MILKHTSKIVAGLVVAAAAAGCHEADATESKAAPAPVSVTVESARRDTVDLHVDVVGTLYGDEQVTLVAKVPGRIQQVVADVGDRVDEGGVLARIDPVDFELALAQRDAALREALAKLGLTAMPADGFDVTTVVTVERARVQAENAAAKFERNRKLFEQTPPLLSEQDFADARTAYEVSKRDAEVAALQAQTDLATARARKADLDAAKRYLVDTYVRAPQPGDVAKSQRFGVSKRNISVGSYVREGDTLYEIIADDPIKFRAAVPERFVSQVHVGQKLSVTVDGSAKAAAGFVRRINPQIDIATRTFEVEGVLENPDRALRPGAFARGSIVIGTNSQALFVPAAAIYKFAGIDKIFALTDGKVAEYIVTRGEVRNGWVQVKENLPQVQTIITSNLNRLTRNMAVNVSGPTTSPAATSPAR
ncbi:MAG: efflux RND transporter periplasmic adaptor subunit [Tepidisphaeraceae bacterium]